MKFEKTEHKLNTDVIINYKGKILFARRNADPFNGKLEIIGGFVEKGEPVENAALREVKEETNLDVKIKGVLGVYSYPTFKTRRCTLSIAFVAESDTDQVKLSEEADELIWVPLEKIKNKDLAWDHYMLIENYRKWLKDNKSVSYTEM